ncbi:MAG: dephospho-CoA kinase [Gemmatimonadales bacterium]|nr:dephospho-CoA kinase [Gemmatimonadota bacterium]MCC7133044.1 dephospho-CoA kinase [Gemmatimonadales bacterium]MDX2058234.1 dephospho-CoA kinase [Gemmatimonadales bacterium]
MKNIGLTGNIAAGKSTVARLFAEWGATIIDADAIVHELQRPGTPVFRAIIDRYGPGVVAEDGTLDRAALRGLVFDDKKALADLNAIVHPAVAAERTRLIAEAQASGVKLLIHDIPLLFEVGDPAKFDAVVLVDAPVAARRERLERTRGLDRGTAESMIAAQMPSAEKRKRATFLIDNDGSIEKLEQRTREVWNRLLRLR